MKKALWTHELTWRQQLIGCGPFRMARLHVVAKNGVLVCLCALGLATLANAQGPSCSQTYSNNSAARGACEDAARRAREARERELAERNRQPSDRATSGADSGARTRRNIDLEIQTLELALAASSRSRLKEAAPACLREWRRRAGEAGYVPAASRGSLIDPCDWADEDYRTLNDYAGLGSFLEYKCDAFPGGTGCWEAGKLYLHLPLWDFLSRMFSYGGNERTGPEQDVPRGLKLLAQSCLLYGECMELENVFEAGLPVMKGKYQKYLKHSLYYPTNRWAIPPDPARALVYLRASWGLSYQEKNIPPKLSKVTQEQLAAARESLEREGLLPRTQVLALSSLGSDVEIPGTFLEWKVERGTEFKDQDEIFPAGLGFPTVVLSMAAEQDCTELISPRSGWKLGGRTDYLSASPWHDKILFNSNAILACLPLPGKALHVIIFPQESSVELSGAIGKALDPLLFNIAWTAARKYPFPKEKQTP
jgi:hypothetical protein